MPTHVSSTAPHTIVLSCCCGGRCPTVMFRPSAAVGALDAIVIHDDFGGEVRMSRSQAGMLGGAIKELLGEAVSKAVKRQIVRR